MAGRPYIFHCAMPLQRTHKLALDMARKELERAGFELHSPASDWEQYANNDDTQAVATIVDRGGREVYVHVLCSANSEASAGRWAKELLRNIEKSHTMPF